MVKIEINGIPVEAREGAMVIEAADQAGIAIPRFCYHKKLSIAANCRMCLVEVERAPKPLPACATPVTDGMKVFTDSPKAIAAQKGVMEFLLINHPLDCPICDQGGECELQDLAVGYGSDLSRYTEAKRVVKDKNIGPLIATDMTRCIHCTRCVRFGTEIAGNRELGATGRGEHMTIGTYIERAVGSEMSGNVIDLCPVGALTSKPFRFQARAWELTQHAAIAPHDAVGSNIYLHVRSGRVMRVVPRENEALNETWISDRDRFSYLGLYSEDRLTSPMVKREGQWQTVSWEEALEAAANKLTGVVAQHGAEQLGVMANPTATLEELYLLQKLARALGTNNIDHRLRQTDFRDQDRAPLYPSLGQQIAELETHTAFLLVGSNVRKDQPLAAHRIRKAVLNGASASVINPIDFDFHFDVAERLIGTPARMIQDLAAVATALAERTGKAAPDGLGALVEGFDITETHRAIAASLAESESSTVLLGNLAHTHPDAAVLRALARYIGEAAGTVVGDLPEAGNSAGASLAGTLPHRLAGGGPAATAGLDSAAMIAEPRSGYIVLGVEPDRDTADPAATLSALTQAEAVVALSAFRSAALERVADVLLPIAVFSETSGTFINAEGLWQSFAGAVAPLGDARPGWKVLRVLGNMLKAEGFDHLSSEEVREEVRGAVPSDTMAAGRPDAIPGQRFTTNGALTRVGDVPIYSADPVVRRAAALQQTSDAARAEIRISPALATRLGLEDAAQATAVQGDQRVTLPLATDSRVPDGAVWLATGIAETAELGPAIGTIELVRE